MVVCSYVLHVDGYSGDIDDAFIVPGSTRNINGMMFSTFDVDNNANKVNCASLCICTTWWRLVVQHVCAWRTKWSRHIFQMEHSIRDYSSENSTHDDPKERFLKMDSL